MTVDVRWRSLLAPRWVVLALVGLTLATRLPFVTRMLYSWDSVNFAFALQRLDVTRHAPHPPGYPYYVGLARLFDLILRDANASFVLVGLIFACLAVVALYGFGRSAFDDATGFCAALSLLFCVTFWAYGLIALSYMTLAFFSIATAWLAYRVLFRGERRLLIWLTIVYAVGGGFRPDLLLFLAPLWLAGLLRATWRERLLNGLVALGGFALWFVPTVWLSGGPEAYWRVLTAYFGRDVLERYSVTHVGWRALAVNVRDLGSYIFYALYAQTILLAVALGWLVWRGEQRRARVWWFLAAWVVPMSAFYTFIHIGDPGYVFAILPALCLLIARFVVAAARDVTAARVGPSLKHVLAALFVAALIFNTGIFLFRDRPLTARGIQRNDRHLVAKIGHVRAHYRPNEVQVLAYASYKHARYYLPEHRHQLWVDRFSRQERQSDLPPGTRFVLLLDDDLPALVKQPERWEPVTVAPGVRLYRLEVHGEQQVVYGNEAIWVR